MLFAQNTWIWELYPVKTGEDNLYNSHLNFWSNNWIFISMITYMFHVYLCRWLFYSSPELLLMIWSFCGIVRFNHVESHRATGVCQWLIVIVSGYTRCIYRHSRLIKERKGLRFSSSEVKETWDELHNIGLCVCHANLNFSLCLFQRCQPWR